MLKKEIQLNVPTSIADTSYGIKYTRRIAYKFVGHDGCYVPNILQYRVFVPPAYIHYFRNVLRTNAVQSVSHNFRLYVGSLQQSSYIAIYSDIPTNYFFGHAFTSKHRFAYYDVANRVIYAEDEKFQKAATDTTKPIFFENQARESDNLLLVFNAIITMQVLPYYEQLLNPFGTSCGKSFLLSYIDEKGSYDYKPLANIKYGLPETYTIYPPKVMIWYKGVYYVYDETHQKFIQFNPQNQFVSMEELNNNGIPLATYNNIPKAAFDEIFKEDKIALLTNGYVFPTYVDSYYWLDKYQETYFLWTITQDQKVLFIPGVI